MKTCMDIDIKNIVTIACDDWDNFVKEKIKKVESIKSFKFDLLFNEIGIIPLKNKRGYNIIYGYTTSYDFVYVFTIEDEKKFMLFKISNDFKQDMNHYNMDVKSKYFYQNLTEKLKKND